MIQIKLVRYNVLKKKKKLIKLVSIDNECRPTTKMAFTGKNWFRAKTIQNVVKQLHIEANNFRKDAIRFP